MLETVKKLYLTRKLKTSLVDTWVYNVMCIIAYLTDVWNPCVKYCVENTNISDPDIVGT